MEGPPFKLIEEVVERIAGALLESYPAVESLRVKVPKPQVRPAETVLAGVAVEIVRHQAA